MKRLLIIGAGGHGRVCADIAEKMLQWDEIVFADDYPQKTFPYKIIGNTSVPWEEDCFVAIGDNNLRKQLSHGKHLVTLIHPSAVIGNRVSIGRGTAVMSGAVINVDTTIGEGVIINTCASVDHDCKVADYAHVSVGARVCGTVQIGEQCFIGAGTTIKNNISICANVVLGIGSVVVKDILDPGVYFGVPAENESAKLR